MTDLIFATPWWLLALLVVVGGVIGWSGLAKQQAGPRNIGLGLIGLAVVLFTLSFFVETDKEKVSRLSLELVKSVQDQDWSKFASLLDANASLDGDGTTLYPNRNELVQGAKDKSRQYNLTAVSAKVTQVEQQPIGILVDIDATSRQSAMGMEFPVQSSWKMHWDKIGGDWHLHQLTCVSIGGPGQPSGPVGRYIGK